MAAETMARRVTPVTAMACTVARAQSATSVLGRKASRGGGPMADNTATEVFRFVRQQIRVLLIAGSRSPEVHFLLNSLQRDQHIEFAAWFQHADPGFRSGTAQGSGEQHGHGHTERAAPP